jgi:hypothetical protein
MRSTGWADSQATNAEKAMFGTVSEPVDMAVADYSNFALEPQRTHQLTALQDFGARDPFAAEIESNFGEKVLGNYNTDHIIKSVFCSG